MNEPLAHAALDFERLRCIGLAAQMAQHLAGLLARADRPPSAQALRVTEVQRESLLRHDGEQVHAARMLPALRAELQSSDDALAVGDWVLAQRNEHGQRWVHSRLPPADQRARRLHDGRDKVTRTVIVSNVDTALLVMGLHHDFSLRRLQRFVALARMAGVAAVVVPTKKDLCAVADARLQQAQAVLPADTGDNRSCGSRGRHTTTARTLHRTPQGACVIDTPGLRTLRLDADTAELGAAFDDITHLALRCRFRDCPHVDEPGCAVRDGVSAERLCNYNKLLREARRDRITALERKTQVAAWKARARHARLRTEAKRR
jgi:ribosome biogenesis GTPase